MMGADIMTEKSGILAIQSDRDRIRDKHISEHAQAKINGLYRNINE